MAKLLSSETADHRRVIATCCALVVATPYGRILYASADARRLLRDFLHRPLHAKSLPNRVVMWLRLASAASPSASLTASAGSRRLFIRRFEPHPADAVALLLESVSQAEQNASRRHAKLTARENEVLRWIAAGKSNREMGEILGLAPATVGKHLERIFQKLGVENRTSAASFYDGTAGAPQ